MKERVKNRKDQRYLNVQERFDRALGKFLKRGRIARLQITEVSKEAKVYDSTFYDHYHHMDAAFEQFNNKHKENLKELYKEIKSQKLSLEITFSKILFFVYKNREYYDAVLYHKNITPLFQIAETFRPLITKKWRNYGEKVNERNFQLFAWEFYSLIYFWGTTENFHQSEISKHAKNLAKLAETACDRLP